MPTGKLKELLESQHVDFTSIPHSEAYTAQEIAALTHVPGKEFAKTVMVKVDGRLAMAVIPASYHADLDMLRKSIGANEVRLAREEEFEKLFSDCEEGAMPPFGNLYGIEEYVDAALREDEMIAFNAGSHIELIRMSFNDFERLTHPKIAHFALKDH
ncbi:MAG: YbaK/EbsC family protein [Thermodesulfovibrionales bacterium]|nr:YbaK/EbsC family protein [Thermodesulfovibrionales bacterium]